MPRALLFFRWAAVVTWLAGAMLLGSHFLDAFLFRQQRLRADQASARGWERSCC